MEEKRGVGVVQLDRLGDFVTSLLTSEKGREGGTSVTEECIALHIIRLYCNVNYIVMRCS